MVGALRRRRMLIVVLTVLGAVIGFGASISMSPVYEGTASLLVGDFEDGNVSNNEILAMQSLAATYADIARREPVLSKAAKDVGLGTNWQQLRSSGHVRVPNESPQVIEITVEGSDRVWARDAAGAIAHRLVDFVHQTSGGTDFVSPQLQRLEQAITQGQQHLDDLQAQQAAAGDSVPVSLDRDIARTQSQISGWQNNYASFKELASTSSHVAIRALGPAEAAATPVSPNIRFNTVMAAGFGFVLSLAIVYLLEVRQARRRQAEAAPGPSLPIIVPPNLFNGIASSPANGRSTLSVGQMGRATDYHEGDVS